MVKKNKKLVVRNTKPKLTVIKKQVSTAWQIKYSFVLGSVVVFLSSVLFLFLLLFFSVSVIKIYLLSVHLKKVDITLTPQMVLEEKYINTENVASWSAGEMLTLPEEAARQTDLNFVISPDGAKFAYVISSNGKEAVSVNNELGPQYDKITFMVFSPDSKRFAYGVKIGSNEAVVLDGQLSPIYDWVFAPYFFTPDSKYFVYKTRSLAGDALVFNLKNSDVYDRIYEPFISPDGSKLIYYARKDNTIYRYFLTLK